MTTEPEGTEPPESIRLRVREWMASLTEVERRELEAAHQAGRLDEVFARGVEKAVAAQQIAAICLDGLTDALRLLQPKKRGR